MSEEINNFDYDDDDYSELLLKYLIRDVTVFDAATKVKLTSEDFVIGIKGSRLYKEFADVAFELKSTPCDKDLFRMHLAKKFEAGSFRNYDEETVLALFDMIFEFEPQNPTSLILNMIEFMKHRRTSKVLIEHKGNPLTIANELSKLNDVFVSTAVSSQATVIEPFAGITPVKSMRKGGIATGIGKMDAKTGGLGKGECGLIIGHSGTGKTAVSAHMMRKAAIAGHKALYISAEEPAENIVHRWYAQQFRIDYTEMYRGAAELEKVQEFGKLTAMDKEDLARLRIVDVRSMAPLNLKVLKEVIDQQCAAGFIPDVVLVDQMDYIKPFRGMAKGASKWQEYEAVSFEMDELSQYRIGPNKDQEFALWVVHQATGDMTWEFTYNDIAGFKGIVKPFDLAVGIGREDREANHINLFSLKVRHSEHFKAPQLAEFSFMTFTDDPSYKPKSIRDKEEKKSSKKGGKAASQPDKNPFASAKVSDDESEEE